LNCKSGENEDDRGETLTDGKMGKLRIISMDDPVGCGQFSDVEDTIGSNRVGRLNRHHHFSVNVLDSIGRYS
jgi:hypothetical protein